MQAITSYNIETLIRKASRDPRRRTIFCLHDHADPVQRMVNALVPGTYIPPHKHEAPDKVELFSILQGRVAVLQFDAIGKVDQVAILDTCGAIKVVDIPPRTYHTVLPLCPSAVLEIIQGPYHSETHKRIAPWALPEDHPKASDYLLYLASIVDNWG